MTEAIEIRAAARHVARHHGRARADHRKAIGAARGVAAGMTDRALIAEAQRVIASAEADTADCVILAVATAELARRHGRPVAEARLRIAGG